jgi:hypothetical protein
VSDKPTDVRRLMRAQARRLWARANELQEMIAVVDDWGGHTTAHVVAALEQSVRDVRRAAVRLLAESRKKVKE